MMRQIGAIAFNTFKGAVHERLFYNLLIFAIVMVTGSILVASLTLGEQSKIIMDMGLASHNLFGMLIAVFLGTGLISGEIERRTIHTVLSKPVGRTTFLMGKYAGLLLTLFTNTVAITATLYVVLALHPKIDPYVKGDMLTYVEPRLLLAIYMTFLELMLLSAVALLFSTFTTATLATVFSLSTYAIGHLSGTIMTMSSKRVSLATRLLVQGVHYLFPNFSQFDIKNQVVHGVAVTPAYFGYTTGYAILYLTLLLLIASTIFSRRDLG